MKVLVLGGSGMLGHKLVQVLSDKFDVWTTLRNECKGFEGLGLFNKSRVFENIDVTEFDTVANLIFKLKPDVVINAVGVIKQKEESKDVIKTLEINSVFPHKVAKIVGEIKSRFITFSTDCVFDGKKGNYSESDLPNAKDLYGRSKHLGEVTDGNCLTLRTSIIGREINSTKSLVEWFINTKDNQVKGFTRAIYSGFPTIVMAEIVLEIIEKHRDLKGLFHVSSDPINKFDLLSLIKKKLSLTKELVPFDDFEIDRSLNSENFRTKTQFSPPSWEVLIERMLEDPTPYEKWRKAIS